MMKVLSSSCLLLLLAAAVFQGAVALDEDTALDTQLCADLLNYTTIVTYNSSASFLAASPSPCDCYLNGFTGYYQMDCELAYCPDSNTATSAIRQDTFLFFGKELRDAVTSSNNTAITQEELEANFEGYYQRVHFKAGALADKYSELRVGLLNATCEMFLRAADGTGSEPCGCAYVDCDGTGTKTPSYNCTGIAGDYAWGQCAGVNGAATTVPSFEATSPLVALDASVFSFAECPTALVPLAVSK